jgi:dolichyl-phosphate-mannose--protein O-mannosyl transferase
MNRRTELIPYVFLLLMSKRRIEQTRLLHSFLLLSGLMLIIITISVSSHSYGSSACANQPDGNSITTSCQRENYSSLEGQANNTTSESNSSSIMVIGHNATSGVLLAGKIKLSSLPSSVPAASEGQQIHVIPFHPKNLTSFSAEKRQADLGLIKPGVKVFAVLPSNHSSAKQIK